MGAGISGLILAFALRRNFDVTVIEKFPDPRKNFDHTIINGSTSWDGRDARHATLSESLPHAMHLREGILTRFPNNKGWQLLEQLSPEEKKWVENFETISALMPLHELAVRFLVKLYSFGLLYWKDFFTKVPEISDTAFQSEKIVRFFRSQEELESGYRLQQKLHTQLVKENIIFQVNKLSRDSLEESYAGFQTTNFFGGLEVEGFTVNLHRLCNQLITLLESEGVTFQWQTQATQVYQKAQKVTVLSHTKKIEGDFAVITTNFDDGWGSQSLPIKHKVQGVLGCWITLPNIYKLERGFKIHEEEPLGIINVTVSNDGAELFLGGGFGYIGNSKRFVENPHLLSLYKMLNQAAQKYFPECYKYACEKNTLSHKYCVRPMTADGMPVLHTFGDQRIVYYSGTNASGFVLAPVMSYMISNHLYRCCGQKLNGLDFSYVFEVLNANRASIRT